MGPEAIAYHLLSGIKQGGKGEGFHYTSAGLVTFSSVPEALSYCLAQLKLWRVENNTVINLRV